MSDTPDPTQKTWGPLTAPERRVLGALIEKAKTTPEYYPMTLAAITTACNQKTAREPITNYDQDDVEETLQGLRKKGAAVMVDAGGRALKWKHNLYEWLKVTQLEAAVIAELLLRGAQTEGDLRARANRMETIADLPALQAILQGLEAKKMVVYLTPPGLKRGVMVTHGFQSPESLDRERQKHANAFANAVDDEPPPSRSAPAAPAPPPAFLEEFQALKTVVERQGAEIQALHEEIRALKSALGA